MLMLAGCAGDAEPRYTVRQQAIQGGYTDNLDKAVVGLVMFVGGGYGTCSGTLITPNIVLTAQHCIAPVENEVQGGVVCGHTSFGSPYDGDQLYITTDTVLSQDDNAYYEVDEVIIPPGDGLCGHDIAILVLDQSVPNDEAVPFPPRVDSPIQADPSGLTVESEIYSAVGYGNTSDGWGWGGGGGGGGSGERRRLDDLQAFCEGLGCGQAEYIYETEWLGDTGVCQGDSGGPALDAESRVIGVVSRGAQGCEDPVYTSVYGWRDWIMGVVIDRSEATGEEVPAWATGGATNTSWPVGDPCADDAECFSGICHERLCTRHCDAEAPCPEGYGCHPDLGICVAPPVGPPCTTDLDCAGGVCHDGLCTRPCGEIPCPDNYTCDDLVHLCIPIPLGDTCSSALDCETGLCVGGMCSRTCDGESFCPAPFGCANGLCRLPALGGFCVVDEDCDGGFCLHGSCTRMCDEYPCDVPWQCDADNLVCIAPPAPEAPACEIEPCDELPGEGTIGEGSGGAGGPQGGELPDERPAGEGTGRGDQAGAGDAGGVSGEDSSAAPGGGCHGGPSSPVPWFLALIGLLLGSYARRRRLHPDALPWRSGHLPADPSG
jgi:hypothetical protein